jgi:tRNA modification GTPase
MMHPQSDTIVALATPAGEGAIGILRISGRDVLPLAKTLCRGFRKRPRRMQLVELVDRASGRAVDKAMVCFMAAPRSYTGEDTLEIYAHGGPLNMRRLVELCVSLGARPAEPGEFTRRAFVNGKLDLTQAEAIAALIGARSERALDNAKALIDGELGKRVSSIRELAVELTADLEACLDFAEQHDAPVSLEQLLQKAAQLEDGLSSLVDSCDRDGWLDGISVALVGAVNAGKSSLFNALLGSTRALVSNQEGTTRDYLEASLNWNGLAVTLIDTAGERDNMSELEHAGHQLGARRIESCDVTISCGRHQLPNRRAAVDQRWVAGRRQQSRPGRARRGKGRAARTYRRDRGFDLGA